MPLIRRRHLGAHRFPMVRNASPLKAYALPVSLPSRRDGLVGYPGVHIRRGASLRLGIFSYHYWVIGGRREAKVRTLPLLLPTVTSLIAILFIAVHGRVDCKATAVILG